MKNPANQLQILMLRYGILFQHHIHHRQDHGHPQRLQHRADQHQKDKQHHLPLLLPVKQDH